MATFVTLYMWFAAIYVGAIGGRGLALSASGAFSHPDDLKSILAAIGLIFGAAGSFIAAFTHFNLFEPHVSTALQDMFSVMGYGLFACLIVPLFIAVVELFHLIFTSK